MSTVQAGWYSDPDGKPCERYWDGQNWTLSTRPISSAGNSPVASNPQSQMTTGWKIALGFAAAFAILILVVAASVPDFWTT